MAGKGRPTDYTPELGELICLEIATNAEGLESICNRVADFPTPSTVYLWRIRHEDFSEKYARARQHQAQLLADQIFTIADTTEPGEVVTIKPDGEERKIADMTEHRKIRIDARKFLAMKLLPRIYGDKLLHQGDADKPIELVVRHIGARVIEGEK